MCFFRCIFNTSTFFVTNSRPKEWLRNLNQSDKSCIFTPGDPCEVRINCQCVFESRLSLYFSCFLFVTGRFLIQYDTIWHQSAKKSGSLLDVWSENYQHIITTPANSHVPDQSTRSITLCWPGELWRSDEQAKSTVLSGRLYKANQHDYERTDEMAISLETTPYWGHPAKKAERGMQRNRTNLVLARKSFRKASAQFACHTWAAGSRVNDVMTGKRRTDWRCVSSTSKNELKKTKAVDMFWLSFSLGTIFPWYNWYFPSFSFIFIIIYYRVQEQRKTSNCTKAKIEPQHPYCVRGSQPVTSWKN